MINIYSKSNAHLPTSILLYYSIYTTQIFNVNSSKMYLEFKSRFPFTFLSSFFCFLLWSSLFCLLLLLLILIIYTRNNISMCWTINIRTNLGLKNHHEISIQHAKFYLSGFQDLIKWFGNCISRIMSSLRLLITGCWSLL